MLPPINSERFPVLPGLVSSLLLGRRRKLVGPPIWLYLSRIAPQT